MARRPRSLAATRSATGSVLVGLLLSTLQVGCITVNLTGDAPRELRETLVLGEDGPKILLIGVDGMISHEPDEPIIGPGQPSTVALVRAQLEKARKDEEIAAILLRIDTPGGTATASEIVYRELMRFKQERGVPVVAQFMGTATSGGYYVAMAADEIVAYPTSVTGSIGVVFLGVEVSGLLDKLGITDQTLTGGEHKDAGSPLRPMTTQERAHLQSIIDDLHGRFREVVAGGRPNLDAAQVETVSDGSIYSAGQALELGLIDRISDMPETVDRLEHRIGAVESRVVTYRLPNSSRGSFYQWSQGAPAIHVDFGRWLEGLSSPGFHYLWRPGAP